MVEWIWFGLLAALCWGTGDFLNGRSSRLTNPENTWFWSFGMLAAAWILYAVAFDAFPVLSPTLLLLAVAVGLCLAVGDLLFIRAARTGKISVASPVLALSAVVAMALGLTAFLETPSAVKVAAGLLAVGGGLLIGFKNLRLKVVENNIVQLFPAILAHGVALFLAKPLLDAAGPMAGTALFESLLLGYAAPFALFYRRKIGKPVAENFAAAGVYFVGFVGYALAVSGEGLVSLAAPVANTFPVFAVAWAVFVYGETLEKHQWLGVALTVIGLAGLAF